MSARWKSRTKSFIPWERSHSSRSACADGCAQAEAAVQAGAIWHGLSDSKGFRPEESFSSRPCGFVFSRWALLRGLRA